MNPHHQRSVHLIVEPRAQGLSSRASLPDGTSAEKGYAPLPIPNAVSFLRQLPDEEPQIMAARPAVLTGTLVLEPVALRDGQPRLLLINTAAARLRVNDGPAPRVTLLRERDQFQFDDSCLFHVAIFHRPQIGPSPADKVGKSCPICLTAFTADPNSVTLCCPCGTVLHLQDPTGLECARALRECPHCRQPLALKQGYAWLPNLDS